MHILVMDVWMHILVMDVWMHIIMNVHAYVWMDAHMYECSYVCMDAWMVKYMEAKSTDVRKTANSHQYLHMEPLPCIDYALPS